MNEPIKLQPKTFAFESSSNFLFSTRYFAAGLIALQNYPYFIAGIGAPAAAQGFIAPIINMPECYTNIETSGKLPAERGFRAHAIGVAVKYGIDAAAAPVAGEMSALNDLLWGSSLQFSQTGKYRNLGALRHWPAGGGAQISGGAFGLAVAANVDRFLGTNGAPGEYAVRHLGTPLDIKANKEFSFIQKVQDAITLPFPVLIAIDLYGEQVENLGSID